MPLLRLNIKLVRCGKNALRPDLSDISAAPGKWLESMIPRFFLAG